MIRKAQLHTLALQRRHDFIRRAGVHLCEVFAERDVCKFLNLLVVFWPDFDLELPWAKKTLTTKDGPSLRLNRLYARALRVADGEDLA